MEIKMKFTEREVFISDLNENGAIPHHLLKGRSAHMEMANKMVYIAGPIGNGGKIEDIGKIHLNVLRAEEIMKQLMLKGYSPICPHLSYYCWRNWKENDNFDMGWEHWMRIDKEFVHACDYFFYMTPEQFGESKGAKMEFEQAKKEGKKIFTSLDEVPSRLEVPA